MVEVNEEPNDANYNLSNPMMFRTSLHQDNEIGEEQEVPSRHRDTK